MSRFDEEPDGDPHGECAAEIAQLRADVAINSDVIMLLRRLIASVRSTSEDGCKTLALANKAWVYLQSKNLIGSTMRETPHAAALGKPAPQQSGRLRNLAKQLGMSR